MSKDTKQQILQKAYLLFLEKGYDAVSISMIQKEVGIGRATMYHYFSSKEELFNEVIEMRYKLEQGQDKLSDYEGVLLSDYLKQRINKGRMVLKSGQLPKKIGMLNYFIMSFQALDKNPDLAVKSDEMHEEAIAKWSLIIKNSVDHGELKSNIDIRKTAKLFMSVRHGIGITSSMTASMEETIDETEEMYQYIFSLISSDSQ